MTHRMEGTLTRIVVTGPQVESITPKATYEALFVLDRRPRFNGEMSVMWLPGQVSGEQHYTQAINPRSGDPWAVPALIVPEYDEFVRVR